MGFRLKKKFSIQRITEYLLMFVVILDCNTVYSTAIKDYKLPELTTVLAVALLLLSLKKYRIKTKSLKKFIFIFGLVLFFLLIYLSVNVTKVYLLKFADKFLIVLPILILLFSVYSDNHQRYRLFNSFTDIMVLEAMVSLFFWLFGSELHLLQTNMSIPAHWGIDYNYHGYFGLYFERQKSRVLLLPGFRNIGIFSEAPMHSLCLIMALGFLVFGHDNKSIRKKKYGKTIKLLILIITIITTSSTTGIILCVMIFVMKILINNIEEKRIISFILVALPILVVGIIVVFQVYFEKSSSNSWQTRIDDFRTGYLAWKQAPLIGNGYSSYEQINYISSFRANNTGFSNSIFTILSEGGLLLFSISFFPIFYSCIHAFKSYDLNIVAISFLSIIEFVVTTFAHTFLAILIIGFFYSYIVSTARVRI